MPIRIAVVGSGYVGLVAGACFADLGHEVILVDNDQKKLAALRDGQVPIHERFLPELLNRHRGQRLTFSDDLKEAARLSSIIFVAVGTPPTEKGDADLSYVESVAREISGGVDDYKVIVDKSTVPVGTADLAGDYVLQLTVNDGNGNTATDTVLISTLETPPIANAGPNQKVQVGNAVQLDGSASLDPDHDSVTCFWSLIAQPSGSNAVLTNAGPASCSTKASFTVDQLGIYVAQLGGGQVNTASGDFVEILDAMDGLPVTIRLLDPPLHEFLPDLTELSVKIALAGDTATEKDKVLLAAVRRLHEQNPMLGLRGVRLGLVIPGLFEMQVRAIAHAAAELKQAGKDPRPEVMIPLTATVQEMEIMRERTEKVLKEVEEETGAHVHTLIGTMIEVPRAAVNAGPIAATAEFFSFGTNDLTQMTWGFSRDDVEGAFFSRYIELGIFGVSPFETIDRDGVGRLVDIAVREGRAARPDLHVGVCGEHGGDPESVHFFHHTGLDYVSCSPFRVPVARLEAGRAALAAGGSDSR